MTPISLPRLRAMAAAITVEEEEAGRAVLGTLNRRIPPQTGTRGLARWS
jgi:hypothetical protein